MKTTTEKQLFLLQVIQEKVLISKNNKILLKLRELEDSLESYISFLAVLQNTGILRVVDVDKVGGTSMSRAFRFIQFLREIDFQNLERNAFAYDDILEIKVFPDFYHYFVDFCKENKLSDAGPDQKLLEIIEKKEIETIKNELSGKQIIWRCYICRAKLTPITSDNIEHYLDLFQKGQSKSCPKGHHNQFQIKDGKCQFITVPLALEKLQQYKLIEPLDKKNSGDKLKNEN